MNQNSSTTLTGPYSNVLTIRGTKGMPNDNLQSGQGTANALLRAAAPLMLKVLQKLEWKYDWEFYCLFCSSCDNTQDKGHEDDCDLIAAIKAAKGE